MPGPLDGIRVLDLTEFIVGPIAGMLLSDMGADVIKVEPPWGEPWRIFRQCAPLESRQYIAVNRGKRSLPLNLRYPEGREILYKLLPSTDVVMLNYRPDVPYKLGVDYETLFAKNPRLIYCENTPFGSDGPMALQPGFDIIIQAMTGVIGHEAKNDSGAPQHVGTPFGDTSTGLSIASAICAALYSRERTGRGQKIQTSMLAASLWSQPARFLYVEASDEGPQKAFLDELSSLQSQGRSFQEVQAHYQAYHAPAPGSIYYRTYMTRDGVLAVGCLNDPLCRKLLDVLDLHDIRYEPGYEAGSPEARTFGNELTVKAEALFSARTIGEWLQLLGQAGVPAGAVRFTEEMLEDEQVVASGAVVELQHPVVGKVKMPGPLAWMSDTPLEAKAASPALGQHTDELLGSLGYTGEQVQRLRDMGVTV